MKTTKMVTISSIAFLLMAWLAAYAQNSYPVNLDPIPYAQMAEFRRNEKMNGYEIHYMALPIAGNVKRVKICTSQSKNVFIECDGRWYALQDKIPLNPIVDTDAFVDRTFTDGSHSVVVTQENMDIKIPKVLFFNKNNKDELEIRLAWRLSVPGWKLYIDAMTGETIQAIYLKSFSKTRQEREYEVSV